MARNVLPNSLCRIISQLQVKLAEHDAALDATMGDGLVTSTSVTETVAAAGALSVTIPHTELNVSGTKVYTLAAGTKTGQRKSITVTTAASTPVWSVTGTFARQGAAKTTIAAAAGAVNDGVDLLWDGASWVVVHTFGTLTVT